VTGSTCECTKTCDAQWNGGCGGRYCAKCTFDPLRSRTFVCENNAWGAGIMLWLVGIAAVYVGAGVAYNQRVVGKNWEDDRFELAPNASFWKTVPGLVVDGLKLSGRLLQGYANTTQTGGYQAVSTADYDDDDDAYGEDEDFDDEPAVIGTPVADRDRPQRDDLLDDEPGSVGRQVDAIEGRGRGEL